MILHYRGWKVVISNKRNRAVAYCKDKYVMGTIHQVLGGLN